MSSLLELVDNFFDYVSQGYREDKIFSGISNKEKDLQGLCHISIDIYLTNQKS